MKYLQYDFFTASSVLLLFTWITITVHAAQKPTIIEHPINTYGMKDQQVSLRCRAEGDPVPTISWYRDGEIVESYRDKPGTSNKVLKSEELLFLSLHPDDQGTYTCNASNSEGSVLSKAAQVGIAFLDSDFLDPQAKTASVGETVLMECRPPKGQPKPLVKWKKNSGFLELNERIKVLEKGDLRIDKAQRNDSGRYQCVAENSAGQRESEVALLTVRQKPRFKVTPTNKEVQVNGIVVFHCEVTGDPKAAIIWRREQGEKIPESRAVLLEDKSLRIDKVQLTDAGNYVCQAGNTAGYVEAVAKLTVISPPGFIQTPEDQDVVVGGSATFICSAAGSPPPEVRWVRGDQHYLPQKYLPANERIRVFTDGKLLITDVRKTDEGKYECRASSYTGSIQSSAVLRVIDPNDNPPPVIVLGPQDQTLKVGMTVTLRCQATGAPSPIIYWYKNNLKINTVASDRRILKLSSGTLQINVLRHSDAANYTCRAVSRNRKTEWTARLAIIPATNYKTTIIQATEDEHILPLPPSNMKVDVADTWITLRWQANDQEARANLLGYRVEYSPYDSLDGWIIAVQKTVNQVFRVSGLTPETGYRLLVRAINPHGVGRPSVFQDVVYTKPKLHLSSLDYSTLQTRINSISVKLMRLKSISTTEVKVTWAVSATSTAMRLVNGFEVKYNAVPLSRCLATKTHTHCSLSDKLKQQRERDQALANSNQEGPKGKKSVLAVVSRDSPSVYAVIEDLRPFVCYEFDVEPFADPTPFGPVRGRESKTKSVLTFDSTPSQAPGVVRARWVTNTTVEISWKPPPPLTHNGVLTGYSVRIIGNETRFSRAIQVSPTSESVRVEHLVPSMGYTVYLAAFTCKGEGIRSAPLFLPSATHARSIEPLVTRPWFIATVVAAAFVWLLLCLVIILVCRSCRQRKLLYKKSGYTNGKKVGKENNHSLQPLSSTGKEPLQSLSNATETSSCGSRLTQATPAGAAARPPDLTMLDTNWDSSGKCATCCYDSSSGGGGNTTSAGSLPPVAPVVNPVAPYASTTLLQQMLNYSTPPLSSDAGECQNHGVCSECGGGGSMDGMWAANHNRGMFNLGEIIPPPPEYPPPPAPVSPPPHYTGCRDSPQIQGNAYHCSGCPVPHSLHTSYHHPDHSDSSHGTGSHRTGSRGTGSHGTGSHGTGSGRKMDFLSDPDHYTRGGPHHHHHHHLQQHLPAREYSREDNTPSCDYDISSVDPSRCDDDEEDDNEVAPCYRQDDDPEYSVTGSGSDSEVINPVYEAYPQYQQQQSFLPPVAQPRRDRMRPNSPGYSTDSSYCPPPPPHKPYPKSERRRQMKTQSLKKAGTPPLLQNQQQQSQSVQRNNNNPFSGFGDPPIV